MAAPKGTLNPAIDHPSWASDCSTCKAIWHHFSDESAPELNLGTHKEALATTCPNHKTLVQRFINYVSPDADDLDSNDKFGFEKRRRGDGATLSEPLSRPGVSWNMLLVNKEEVPQHPGNGRLLDKDWADIETIKRWKDRCLCSHGTECEDPFRVSPTRPAWLVDVQNRCIVPGDTPGSYVAISYTYGKFTQPNMTSRVFSRLQESFALAATEFSAYISPIIHHAMFLTAAIDERYLWADALCVTHHDPKAASEQLEAMGTIYANAVVTIIATDGDSESGILGLKGVSGPRGIQQNRIPFGDETLIVRNTYYLNDEKPEPYFDRGWTFQEYELSGRKLIAFNQELHWLCACSTWHEELTLYTEIDGPFSDHSDILKAGFPDDFCLSRYLFEYSYRSLTFEEDALPAISGLLSIFSRSFDGGFLYGIPEMFFEHSLGWRGRNLRRRVQSGRPAENRFEFSGLPSWSWLSWKGFIAWRNQSAVRIRSNPIEEAFPITAWYTSEFPSDPPERRRRIQSAWYDKRDGFKDFTKPMPSGWSRREVATGTSSKSEPHPHPDGCDKYVLQHESISEYYGRPLEWYYPFPVDEVKASTPLCMPNQTQYLFCETFQAQLSGYQQEPDRWEYSIQPEAKLCNKYGKVIGKLDLNDEDSTNRFPEIIDTANIGLQVDVIAICKLKRYTKMEREGAMLDLPQTTKDLYLVLWVEWKDGIAYRHASGEVIAEEWEKLDLERISLILG